MGNILPVVEIDLKISKDCGDSGPWETQGVAALGEMCGLLRQRSEENSIFAWIVTMFITKWYLVIMET